MNQVRENPTMNPRVRIIPATIDNFGEEGQKKRIAAYARVSTLEEAQQSSYDLQVSYFKEHIERNPEWEFYKVYSDEGVTGTNTKHRTGFNEMIKDAKAGKFDYIITKSISRFARNTLDCLTYVRMLKDLDKPVGIIFDRENINTLDSGSSTILAIIASLAEEESRTISANVSWGVTKRFSQGIPHIPTTYFLGYDQDENGKLVINEEEAKIIRRIYKELLDGKGAPTIAKGLTKDKLKTARGNTNWTEYAVNKILRNEKHAGHALCQKTITRDPISHFRVKNDNHKPQYFIRNHHPAIISEEDWQNVQKELDRRRKMSHDPDGKYRSRYSGKAPFSNMLVCGNCGMPVTRRRLTSSKGGVKYRFTTWHCKIACKRMEVDYTCNAKYIWEEVLETAFNRMLLQMANEKEKIRLEGEEAIEIISLTREERERLEELEGILDGISDQISEMSLRGNLTNDVIYDSTLRTLIYESQIYQQEYENLLESKDESIYLREHLDKLLESLENLDKMDQFKVDIFQETVERGILNDNYEVEFIFKCGIKRIAHGWKRGKNAVDPLDVI